MKRYTESQRRKAFVDARVKQYMLAGHDKSVAIRLARLAWRNNR